MGRRPRMNIVTTTPTETKQTGGAAAPVEKAQPPRPADFIGTPEFAEAVSAAVSAQMAPVMEKLAAMNMSPVPGDEGAQSLFRQMALAIAEISDQGTNRKRVAPEVLAARAAAHDRMVKAILAAKGEHERDPKVQRPLYRAIGKMYLNERFIEPFVMDPATKKAKSVEFYWSGVPNEVMRPVNPVAEEIFGHFLESIGSVAREKSPTPVWVTAGGLVIKGEGPQRRSPMSEGRSPVFDDLEIVDEFNASDPTKQNINVLGTIAAPARQNFAEIRKGA